MGDARNVSYYYLFQKIHLGRQNSAWGLLSNYVKRLVRSFSHTAVGHHRAFQREQFHWEIACAFFPTEQPQSRDRSG